MKKPKHLMFLVPKTSWRNLGNDSFEITLVVFTRCIDGASPFILSPPSITSDSCANSYSVSLGNPIDSTYIDLTPVCITQQKPCTFSGGNGSSSALIPLGYLKVTWRYKIYLGGAYSNCCWYKIRWQICCKVVTLLFPVIRILLMMLCSTGV